MMGRVHRALEGIHPYIKACTLQVEYFSIIAGFSFLTGQTGLAANTYPPGPEAYYRLQSVVGHIIDCMKRLVYSL